MTTKDGTRSNRAPRADQRSRPPFQNLWWSWQPQAERLYRDLDPVLFESLEENPVLLLSAVAPERLRQAAADHDYLARYDEVMAHFDALLTANPATTWVGQHQPELIERPVAYFSAEFGVHPIAAHLLRRSRRARRRPRQSGQRSRAAARRRLAPLPARLSPAAPDPDGWQLDVTPVLEPRRRADRRRCSVRTAQPLHVSRSSSTTRTRRCALQIWRVQVGRVPLFLLDTDVEGNPDWTAHVSSRLYGGDQEHRLRQEMILGIGGVRALRAMGIDPVFWHGNEGHAGFHLLERSRAMGCGRADLRRGLAAGRSPPSVFTTHTPVPAGHDVFPPHLMDRYFSYYWPQLGLDRATSFWRSASTTPAATGFNMTALAMRLSGFRNGVSARHGEITRAMWHDLWPDVPADEVPITSITNGVHLPTWISAAAAGAARPLPAGGLARAPARPGRLGRRSSRSPTRSCGRCTSAAQATLLAFLREYARRQLGIRRASTRSRSSAAGPVPRPERADDRLRPPLRHLQAGDAAASATRTGSRAS